MGAEGEVAEGERVEGGEQLYGRRSKEKGGRKKK